MIKLDATLVTRKYYQELAKKIGVNYKIPKNKFLKTPELPDLNWTVGDEVTSIYTELIYRGRYHNYLYPSSYLTKIRIETIRINSFSFEISKETGLVKFGKKLWIKDIQMDEKEFDDKFLLISTDENRLRNILSSDLCNAFSSFGTDLSPELKYENGAIIYKEFGKINSHEDVERIYTIYLIMQDINDKLKKESKPF
ncbi:hypothetical protein BH09BAC5_BH09BAC5_28130 [soil metagenome]